MTAPRNCLATMIAAIAAVMFLLPRPAWAQTDWLKKGQELLGTATKGPAATTDTSQVAAGLKEALRVGSETVVARLGQTDGFNADPAIHIPLPKSFTTVQSALKPLGMSYLLDDLETKLKPGRRTGHAESEGAVLVLYRADDAGRRDGDLQWSTRRGNPLLPGEDVQAAGGGNETDC